MGRTVEEKEWRAVQSGMTEFSNIKHAAAEALRKIDDLFQESALQSLKFRLEPGGSSGSEVWPWKASSSLGDAILVIVPAVRNMSTTGTEELELVGRVLALCTDPLDVSENPRTLPPVWELVVRNSGAVFAVNGDDPVVIPRNSLASQPDHARFIAGMLLLHAIANRASQ